MGRRLYTCGANAESINTYLEHGFHPVHLHDVYQGGRYKIIHKLGFGAFSTVWAARDQLLKRNVAIKVVAAQASVTTREHEALQLCQEHSSHDSRSSHILQIFDQSVVNGPNGAHRCIVYELLGPSVQMLLSEVYFPDDRLPGDIAKAVSYQALQGVAYLHELGIGHGDIHTNNLAFSAPQLASMSEEELMEFFGEPRTSEVKRSDGEPLEPIVPKYIVWPARPQYDRRFCGNPVKLIDFGESFTPSFRPGRLHTPTCSRPPELLFDDSWDHRVDLWSAGCMIFELIAGQSPFDGLLLTEQAVISQIINIIGPLPAKWQENWENMVKQDWELAEPQSLGSWLEEVYKFKCEDLKFDDNSLKALERTLKRLMRIDPESRDSAAEVLQDPWFREDLDRDSAADMGSSNGESNHKNDASIDPYPSSPRSSSHSRPSMEPESKPTDKETPSTATAFIAEDSQTSMPEDSQASMPEDPQTSIPENSQASISNSDVYMGAKV